jgi:hypothetical protein
LSAKTLLTILCMGRTNYGMDNETPAAASTSDSPVLRGSQQSSGEARSVASLEGVTAPHTVVIREMVDGCKWSIEVGGDEIATCHNKRFDTSLEAYADAKSWVRHHEQLGYELKANWWAEA